MGESIYSKMFKIDAIIQQITLIIIIIIIITIIPLYHIIFLIVFWGKEKKSIFSSDALVVKKQLSKLKSNKCFLIKIEYTVTHTQGVLNFYWAVCIVMGLIQTLEDGFISVSVTQSTCF